MEKKEEMKGGGGEKKENFCGRAGQHQRLYNQDNQEYRQNMVVPIKWVDVAKKIGLGFKRKIGPQMLKWRK